jgi:uncharacterized 2Fe-2S/4Fe-4S cluster protein (DUF4445 family)
MDKQYIIKVLPANISITAAKGHNLYQVLAAGGFLLDGDCGGRGICRRCRVRIKAGNITAPHIKEQEIFSAGELEAGWRLACLQTIRDDLTVELSPAVGVEEERSCQIAPAKHDLAVAIDLGTTSIAAGLLDLANGQILSMASQDNSQRSFGADVITRIDYCLQNADGLSLLQQAVWRDIAALLGRLCQKSQADVDKIKVITVVANSVMSHLAWNISPQSLAQAPYEPTLLVGQKKRAGQLPLAPYYPRLAADVYLLPNIGGYVGSDTLAAILACDLWGKKDAANYTLLLDIGTNGEIVLVGRGQILAASAAAGPAFEGAHIICGMRATAGALWAVCLGNDDIACRTICDKPLCGICGSGLLSLVAFLRRQSLLDQRGRLAAGAKVLPALSGRLQGDGQKRRFLLKNEVALYQSDIREFQLAKGAIAACWQSLLTEAGADVADIEQVLLAGAFGNKLAKEDAIYLGLLPPIAKERIDYIGNAAWQGAYLAAIDDEKRQVADNLAKQIRHVDTAGQKGFQNLFIKALNF